VVMNKKDEFENHAFEFQLEMFKKEIDTINQTISRFDEHARATRNWALVTWAGSIALILRDTTLHSYIYFTAFVPILFWLVDARWTSSLRKFLYRQDKINEFLNSADYQKSFEKKTLVGFTLYDPSGSQYKHTKEFRKYINIFRSATKYLEVSAFYIGMIILSIGISILLQARAHP
jgi:hypothetical protein